jgi:hypothetical protein
MCRVRTGAQARMGRQRLDKGKPMCDTLPMTARQSGRILRVLTLAWAAYAVIACGDGRQSPRLSSNCADPTAALVPAAMDTYLASVLPKPQRFLIAAGTDSALPAAAESRLQRVGPTFIFPADTILQRRVLRRLDSIAEPYGDLPTLLVTYRGVQRSNPHRAIVRFGGHFLGGANDGKVAHRTVQFVCETARWNVQGTQEERRT